ncbi:putative immunity protein [Sinomonas sp. R1AF57]|uniref:putative immunity protein n=1 Tax=Sinomonas sp. R1AF57 TaxID=2020377 RepID=UPI000B60BC11|nr:hypothetical protein [Sinomonas sp. R1AF57]ASN53592.1 hypothetical protein CGQ25_17120 [Sinomonas sp. R1AF57]
MAAGQQSEAEHHALALWAADCAERVLPLFERERHDDARPRHAVEAARAWLRGEIEVAQARAAAMAAHDAAQAAQSAAARSAARAAEHAAATAHVASHAKKAASYADRAEREGAGGS